MVFNRYKKLAVRLWPRGKYNGQRIVGVSFKIVLDVTAWEWLPIIGNHQGMFHWLCFRTWTEWQYNRFAD